jgi:hypothetical protein
MSLLRSIPWKVYVDLTGKEIPTSMNPKFYYGVHSSPSFHPIVSYFNPVRSLTLLCFRKRLEIRQI